MIKEFKDEVNELYTIISGSGEIKKYNQNSDISDLNDLLAAHGTDKIKDYLYKTSGSSSITNASDGNSFNFMAVYKVGSFDKAKAAVKNYKVVYEGLTDAIKAALNDTARADKLINLCWVYHRTAANFTALKYECKPGTPQDKKEMQVKGQQNSMCYQINPYVKELLMRTADSGTYAMLKYVANESYVMPGLFNLHVYNSLKKQSKVQGKFRILAIKYAEEIYAALVVRTTSKKDTKFNHAEALLHMLDKKKQNLNKKFLELDISERLTAFKEISSNISIKRFILIIIAVKCNKVHRHKALCQAIRENFKDVETAGKICEIVIPGFYSVLRTYLASIKLKMAKNASLAEDAKKKVKKGKKGKKNQMVESDDEV